MNIDIFHYIIYHTMDNTMDMRVIKRDGKLVDIAFDKILNRIKKIGQEVNIQINDCKSYIEPFYYTILSYSVNHIIS